MQVSIVVAFHNARDYLRPCIESLTRLNWPREDYEIVLVDDGSTDGSIDTIRDLLETRPAKVKVIDEKDRGPAVARNSGIRSAAGNVVLFTDPDCTVNQDWLLKHSRHYYDPAMGGVEGRVETDWEKLLIPRITAPAGFRYVTANMSYRRDALEDAGLFDERFWYKEDDELAFRVLKKGWKIHRDQEAVVYHPPKTMSLRNLFRQGLKHEFDVLFYMKHPDIATKVLRAKRIGSIALTPISAYLGLAGMVLTIAVACLWVAPVISLMALTASLLSLAALEAKFKKQFPRKSALWMVVFSLFMAIGRLRGSLKYRVLFL